MGDHPCGHKIGVEAPSGDCVTALNINLFTANTPSTSGTWTFSVTQKQVIRAAAIDLGAIDPQEDLTAQEYSDCSFKLNMMTKQWMGNTDFAPGLKIWTRRRADLFMGVAKYAYNLGQTGDHWVDSTAGLAYPQSYGQTYVATSVAANATTIPVASIAQQNIGDYVGILNGNDIYWTKITNLNPVPNPPTMTIQSGVPNAITASAVTYVWNYTNKAVRPLSIITCVLRDIYANDTPLNFMTTERYESLPTKVAPTNIADPTAILYESQFTNQSPNGILYLDVAGAQDVTKRLHCVYLAPTQDLVNPGDSPDYPQQWYRALTWGHAKDIASMFDCEWTQTMEQNLTEALAIAKQADPAITDVYFEPYAESPYTP
jgi:hypothetical protein